MHSSTFQTLLVLLPLLISSSIALPDNIFGKREAKGHGAGAIPSAASGSLAGSPTGVAAGPGGSGAPACMSQGGWQACMSSLCGGGAGASATDITPPTTGSPADSGTTAAAVQATAKKMRRQAASASVTGGAPAQTGTGSASSGHGSGKNAKGASQAAACSGFSDFVQSAGATGGVTAPQVTGLAAGTTGGNSTNASA